VPDFVRKRESFTFKDNFSISKLFANVVAQFGAGEREEKSSETVFKASWIFDMHTFNFQTELDGCGVWKLLGVPILSRGAERMQYWYKWLEFGTVSFGKIVQRLQKKWFRIKVPSQGFLLNI
jgi:hypothetical protein